MFWIRITYYFDINGRYEFIIFFSIEVVKLKSKQKSSKWYWKLCGTHILVMIFLKLLKETYASKFGKCSSGHRTENRSVFIPVWKGNAKECSNCLTIAFILHASKVMHKFLQAMLQQYKNWELPDVQAGFRKGRGTRDQIANICWIIEKAREFQKNIYFCFIHYAKAFDCVDHSKLWNILKEMGIPYHLTCLLRNLYAGQETTVKTGHETTDWFQIGKRVYIKAVYCHLLI